MSLPDIFHSSAAFCDVFVEGLDTMLDDEGLGVFILVLANASYDERIYDRLKGRLGVRYSALIEANRHGPDDAPDDYQVFKQLVETGLHNLELPESRRVGNWNIQFNQLRSFRPSRMSDIRVDSLNRPFAEAGFHFNKPFLKNEILWEGQLQGSACRLLYNKFPFADMHGILVIEPNNNCPQYLTSESHQYIWQLCEVLGGRMPAVGFGYNAYGAAASVNHQHFHMYIRQAGCYPVEENHWQHHGGKIPYPLDCMMLGDCHLAWQKIEALHESNTAYNLLYRPGLVYILPRLMQGHFRHADWLAGIGWTDLAGELTATDRRDYDCASAPLIEAELRQAALSAGV